MSDTTQIASPIVLIGPPSTGKSTLAPLLAQRLGLAHVSLDDLRWAYYDEIGIDHARAARLSKEGGFEALYWYMKPFEAHALERVLVEHADKVIELGGGHSVYEDEALFERARRALLPIRYVVLVMPSGDLAESCQILRTRTLQKAPHEGWEPSEDVLRLFDHLARHPSNRLLAKQFVYTSGRTPGDNVAEIERLMSSESIA